MSSFTLINSELSSEIFVGHLIFFHLARFGGLNIPSFTLSFSNSKCFSSLSS